MANKITKNKILDLLDKNKKLKDKVEDQAKLEKTLDKDTNSLSIFFQKKLKKTKKNITKTEDGLAIQALSIEYDNKYILSYERELEPLYRDDKIIGYRLLAEKLVNVEEKVND